MEERQDTCKKVKYFWRAFEVICAFPAADMEGRKEVKGGKGQPGDVAQGMRIKFDFSSSNFNL